MTLQIGSPDPKGAPGWGLGAGGRTLPRARSPQPIAKHGFTLIEVLVSIAILASAVVLILQAFVRGAYVMALAKNRLRAYTFASAKMADVELALQHGREPDPDGRFSAGREQFRWRLDRAPADDPQLERVTLTVSWRQGRRAYESHTATLRRLTEQPEEGL